MYTGLANVLIASFTTFRIPACEQLDGMAVGTKNKDDNLRAKYY